MALLDAMPRNIPRAELGTVAEATLMGHGQEPARGGVRMAIQEGKLAPDFALEDQDGKSVSLSDYAGRKNVLLYFYPRDDTPGCTKEACGFRDDVKQFEKLGVVVLGVSADGAESHQ